MAEATHLMVFCTCPSEEAAQRIASELVRRSLAACVNIVPGLTSVYEWKGSVETDPEVLLIAKTTETRYSALERTIVEQHEYELPEVVAVGITKGLPGYLEWITEETREQA